MVGRIFASLLVVGALVVACSDDVSTTQTSSSSSGSSGNVGTSGKPTKTGSSPPISGSDSWDYGEGTSSSGLGSFQGGVGFIGDILSLKASKSVCGGALGQCYDAQSLEVTFSSSTMKDVRCIELANDAGTQDAATTKDLASNDIDQIKIALSNIRTSSGKVTGFDGPQIILEVRTKSGTKLYAQTSGCGPQDQMTQITSGWTELWVLLSGLSN